MWLRAPLSNNKGGHGGTLMAEVPLSFLHAQHNDSTAQHSTALYRLLTAQYSTAQHSTALSSTALLGSTTTLHCTALH